MNLNKYQLRMSRKIRFMYSLMCCVLAASPVATTMRECVVLGKGCGVVAKGKLMYITAEWKIKQKSSCIKAFPRNYFQKQKNCGKWKLFHYSLHSNPASRGWVTGGWATAKPGHLRRHPATRTEMYVHKKLSSKIIKN